jgi:hypothetical protein
VNAPLYRCHKEVRAFRIDKVLRVGAVMSAVLVPTQAHIDAVLVGPGYLEKHDPQPGGYFVVYADGYQSFSPAEAFEDGYTRID